MNAAEKAEPWWAWGDPIKWERTKRWTERSVHIRRMFSSNFTRRGNSRSRLGAGQQFQRGLLYTGVQGKNSRYRASWRKERSWSQ